MQFATECLAAGIGTVPYLIFAISGVMMLVWIGLQLFGKGKKG